MTLVVTIPAYNEAADIAAVIREVPRSIAGVDSVQVLVVDDGSSDDTVAIALEAGADWVVRNGRNMGLAYSFQRAVSEALRRGADIVVNTDSDNHYDQSAIPELIEPIVEGRADIVVGSRVLDSVEMPAANRYGNRAGNFVMQRLLGIPGIDVSTGFRAYSREAVLRSIVFSRHTYTHETLLSALDQQLVVENRPIAARSVSRPSRLIQSVPRHVARAGTTIGRSFLLYRPLQSYLLLGLLVGLVGMLPIVRFLFEFAQGDGDGHIQSLIIGAALIYLGGQIALAGLMASAIRANRRLLQERLRNTRELLVVQASIEARSAVEDDASEDRRAA